MICAPGKCIKCGVSILRNGVESPLYNEVQIRLSPGESTSVGICRDCTLEDSDLPNVIEALNDYYSVTSAFQIVPNESFLSIMRRMSYEECVHRRYLVLQGGRCPGCHEAIEEHFVVIQGVGMFHEDCNPSDPIPAEMKVANAG